MSWMPANGETFSLWKDGALDARGDSPRDQPALTPYWPLAYNEPPIARPAVVICPGGAYRKHAAHEGEGYARWLSMLGLACFVLRYRLGGDGYRHPVALHDAARAVRFVRAHAADWELDAHRIGIMGSSAGGHLSAHLMTAFDGGQPGATDHIEAVSSRPDFGVLCYPVMTMSGPACHTGSRSHLLGESPSDETRRETSPELNVRPDSPPVFIWHTSTDASVPVENATLYAQACRNAGVPYELHVYDRGGHGIGLDHGHPWTAALRAWLEVRGYLTPPKAFSES